MSGSLVKVGFLVPLNDDCEESEGLLKIPIFEGLNVIGRSDLSVSDRRVSRKHISLTAKVDGFVEVVVEGPNPIIVNSGHQRTKICSKDKALITHGDILQFIPGRLNFKLVTLHSKYHASPSMINARISNEGDKLPKEENMRLKRKWQDVEDNTLEQTVQGEQGNNNNSSLTPVKVRETLSQLSKVVGSHDNKSNNGCQQQAIREFRVDKNLEPLTFRLLCVQGLPRWANTSSISIENVVEGNVIVAIISNYMVDMDWLLSACPNLRKIPHGLIIHGESDGRAEHIKKVMPASWVLHHPPLPISYGTHHSKAMLLIYPQGVRVVVHTANLIYVDWNNKTQGLWMQDFPWKDQKNQSSSSPFENDLIEYLSALKLPEVNVNLPALGNAKINASFFRRFNYSSASVRLIASVPGYHKGSNLRKWGHMKLQSILRDCIFHKEFQRSPLVYQFSSLGSLDEKWMAELASSMSSGLLEDKTPLGLGKAMIIWPTVEDVRCSLEGYAAGSAIPSPEKNVAKEFLKKYWARWKADHTGRGRAMPHIKSYARYNGQNIAWFILTSANLSKAAWGALQKNNSQLMIRSYELGILFLPSMIKAKSNVFSCTDNGSSNKGNGDPVQSLDGCKTKLLTLCAQGNDVLGPSSTVIQLPVPYELPPEPYTNEDVPWSWDRRYNKKDVYGHVWPLRVQHYTNEDS